MGTDLGRDLGMVEETASGADARVALMLRHDGGEFGQLGDLMPAGFGVVRRGLLG
jgi:hypothetical protein